MKSKYIYCYLSFFFIVIQYNSVLSWAWNFSSHKGSITTPLLEKPETLPITTPLLEKPEIHKQCIISSKTNKISCSGDGLNNDISEDDYYLDKRLVTISPGGVKGFYLLGILTFIKENYDTSQLVYSGSSAGSWSALFMSYRGDFRKMALNMLTTLNTIPVRSLRELQYFMKYKILTEYEEADFDLKRIFIGITGVRSLKFQTHIIADFESLEDAIDACIASSHIPFVTGPLTHKYKGHYSFDGGFSGYPYLRHDGLERIMHITPGIWRRHNPKRQNWFERIIYQAQRILSLLSLTKYSVFELYDNGYTDARNHREELDNVFGVVDVDEIGQINEYENAEELGGIEF